MADIKVTFSSLEALSGDIHNQVSAIEGYLNDLQRQISNLEQDWEGGASAGFQTTKQTWFTSADDLRGCSPRSRPRSSPAPTATVTPSSATQMRWDQG